MQSAMTSSMAAEDDNRTTGPVELSSRPPPPNNPSDELAGSTGLVVLIRDDLVYCGNAGDSRAVVSRRGLDRKTDLWWDVPPKRDLVPKHRLMVGSPDVSGRNNPSRPKFLLASALSTDHKPTLVEERRRIVAAGGWVDANRVNGNLALSRALGDFVFKRNPQQAADQQIVSACPDVAVCRIDPAEDEFILLGCDGIWDVMTNQEVVSFVRARLAHGMHPVKICEDLMMRCLAPDCHTNGLGCDNMTVVLVCFLFNRPPIELQQRCARTCPGGAAVDVLAPD